MSDWKPISEIARVRRGASPRPISDQRYFGGNVGWVRIVDVTRSNRYLKNTEQYLSALGESRSVRVDKGDLVMSICGTIGKPMMIDMAACIHDGFVQLYDLGGAVTEYLYYVLQHSEDAFIAKGQPGTQVNLNTDLVGKHIIFAPQVSEQRKVAKILSTVDNLIEKTQALIDKYQSIKQGMMHGLFTRGVDENGHLRPSYEEAPHLYKESELGWIPKEWEVVLLDSVAHRGSGHTPSKSHPAYWSGGIKWVSLADSSKLDNLYISETDKEISELGLANSSAVKHPKGTVVLSRDAGIGKSAILSEEMAVSQHFMAWRCGEKLNNYFLYYWMQLNKPVFEAIAMGSTIKTIGLSYFKKIRFALPPKNEQELAANTLLTLERKLVALSNELNKYQSVKSGLMQDLLTGKVRVKVDA